jgi:multicomponent Na+:H+ antiporter subunit C
VIIVLAITVAVLYGVGAFLMLQRNLSRIVIGLAFFGHGANLLLLMAGGRAGRAPFVGEGVGPASDPLPQALALTAVVITFGVSAYLLTLAYRSWLLIHSDEVEDDVEDRRIAEMATARIASEDEVPESTEDLEERPT